MEQCIQGRLRLVGNEIVADVGCGTGLYSRNLSAHASAVVCVDQSEAMLRQLPASKKLIPVVASVEDLAAGSVSLPYGAFDAMLLKEVLHHVADQAAVMAGLAGLLRPGGRALVVMLPTTITYPLFDAALEYFSSHQPDPRDIARQMSEAGLDAELTFDSFALTFPTERYLQMVRNRYMSLLSHFDDVQLEAGIEEIRAAHPGAEVRFADRFAFILGVKR
jgi:SAM-dependent methyltransferase